jgi:cytochrome c oxidase cbb3-type subunit 1
VKLWSEKLGVATAILWNLIILSAVVALPMGLNKGWEYAELPTFTSVMVVIAWVLFGINIFATIAGRKYQQMYVTVWYMMGCILWTAFVYTTGNVAVFFTTGTNQANLNWMYVHNAVGLIFTPIGLGIAYYFIPKSSDTPLYSHRLSMVGFWSLAFVYVWTGAHHMIHGPISQWLQTIAITFSLMLLIPVWAVVYNFFATLKGQMQQLRDNVPLKFLLTGTVFYLLTCFQGPMHSLRSVNAIVSKTDWIPGHAHMALLGCFSFYAIAGTYYAVPRMWRIPLFSDKLANWTFWLMLIGGIGFFTTLWLGGFWQGWQWNNPAIPFIDTVVALKPVWLVRFFCGSLIFCGIVSFGYNIMATVIGRHDYAR